MTYVAGIDGCPKGWVVIVLSNGHFARAEFSPTFAELLTNLAEAQVIAVDIPIGLPDGAYPRLADVEAKKLLGKFAPKVFMTPPRVVLEAATYAEANRLSKSRFKRGISAQAYALKKKIFEADAVAAYDDRIYEVHPELSFMAMNGPPLGYSKKSWHGQFARLRLLKETGIVIPDELGAVGRIPPDDIIDAAAAAWSAERIGAGTGDKVGKPVPDLRPNRNAGFIWY